MYVWFVTYVSAQYHYTYADPTLQITGLPNNLYPNGVATLQYFQASFGPNFCNNTDNYKFSAKIEIPNGPLDGCSTYPNATRHGGSWNGTAVFVQRATCGHALKVPPAAYYGVAAIFIVSCSPGPPTFCATGRAIMNALYSAYPTIYPTIPVAMISYAEGTPIMELLLQNNSLNLTVNVKGTGRLLDSNGNIKQGLIGLANSLPTKPADRMIGAMYIQDWAKLDLSLSQNDPCTMINKPYQLMCKEGKLVRYENGARAVTGSVSPLLNNLVDLEMFSLDKGAVTGYFPDIRNISNLKSLVLSGNTGITSMFNSIGSLQQLKVFAVNSCSLTVLPSDIGMIATIELFWVQNNKLTSLPYLNLQRLTWFDVSNNKIKSALPNFSNCSLLTNINIAFNNFSSTDASEMFQNLPELLTINLAYNSLSGPLPKFDGCSKLQIINVNDNVFVGKIPSSWNIPIHCSNNVSQTCTSDYECGKGNTCSSVKQVYAARNQLAGPFNFSATSLTDIDVSNNFMNYNEKPWLSKDIGGEMDFTVNTLANVVKALLPPTIININIAANKFQGNIENYNIGTIINNIQILNISNNKFSTLPTDMWGSEAVAGVWRIFDASNNNMTGVIPVAKTKIFVEMVKLDGNPYLNCIPPFDFNSRINCSKALPSWVYQIDSFTKKSSDTFACPILKGAGELKLQLVIDPVLYGYSGCNCDRGYYGSAPFCLNIPSNVNTRAGQQISDAAYGSNRMMLGVDIAWTFSGGKGESFDDIKGYIVQLYLNRSLFNDFTDIIEIYEGDASLSGKRVLSVRGIDTDPVDNLPNYAKNSIVVLNKNAVILFRSQKTQGQHFISNYTAIFDCPPGFQYDINSFKCQKLFVVNESIQIAIFAIISVFMTMLITITGVIIKKRNSLIIRSSSFPFCLSMLLFMIALGIGSYFYALYPEKGDYICNIRPWLTACPLVGILSALLVKVDRIRRIFTSKELVVQTITNSQLAKTMSVMMAVEIALLIGFSASRMSTAIYKVGYGYTSDVLVAVCTSSDSQNGADAFNTWLIIQFIYIAAFLMVAVCIAWSVRKVPSAFNEAPSIASSLLSLAVLLIILIPLNYMVDDNPNALMLIRGIGQILVTSVLALFFFGPKLYLIIDGKDNDKTLSSMGSSRSSSSTSSANSENTTDTEKEQAIYVLLKAIKTTFEGLIHGSIDRNNFVSAKQTFIGSFKSKTVNQIIGVLVELETQIDKFQAKQREM